MRIILRENVPNVGKIGDVLTVADGFGRNYLLPRNLAVLAWPSRAIRWIGAIWSCRTTSRSSVNTR